MVGCDAHDGSHASAITYSDVLKTGEDRTMIGSLLESLSLLHASFIISQSQLRNSLIN